MYVSQALQACGLETSTGKGHYAALKLHFELFNRCPHIKSLTL